MELSVACSSCKRDITLEIENDMQEMKCPGCGEKFPIGREFFEEINQAKKEFRKFEKKL